MHMNWLHKIGAVDKQRVRTAQLNIIKYETCGLTIVIIILVYTNVINQMIVLHTHNVLHTQYCSKG